MRRKLSNILNTLNVLAAINAQLANMTSIIQSTNILRGRVLMERSDWSDLSYHLNLTAMRYTKISL
jgi:hypothetical protein